MPELSLAQLAEATGGALLRGDPGLRVRAFGIHTRQLPRGGVFFALRGTRTDGHRFVAEAAANGAAAAVVSAEPAADVPAQFPLLRVEDGVAALAAAARWVRRRQSGSRWFAITGSNGKTTTKELLAEGLSATRRVHRTAGNLNNHLGVPLSILAAPDDAECIVLELAMSAPGEIAALASIADPDVGLVTNIRAVHLQFFGTLDNIAAAKGELFATLRDDAVAAVNLDDPHVRVQATRHAGRQVTFGRHPRAALRLEDVVNRFVPGASMTLVHEGRTYRVELRLGGAHAALDALGALAAVVAADEPIEPAIERMQRLEAGPGRGRVLHLARGIVLVDDTYNSSPAALAAVLDTLRATPTAGRRVLAMGDMLELGNVEGALHREAGKRAAAAGVQMLATVGALARQAGETARRAGVGEVHHFADASECAAALGEYLRDGDLVVIKGSRGMRMERIVEALARVPGAEVA